MYADYIASVLQTFHEKKDNHELSNRWSKLTRASLREECLAVYQKRHTKDDVKMLSEFFGFREDEPAVAQAILQFELDKFRPFVNFINGKTTDTVHKNIELLAWLIDFEYRPLGKYEKMIKEGELKPPTLIENGPKADSGEGPIAVVTPKTGVEDNMNTDSENPPQDSPVKDPLQEPDNDGNTNIGGGDTLVKEPEPMAVHLSPPRPKRRAKYLIPLAVLIFLLLGGGMLYKGFKNTAANTTTLDSPALPTSEFCMYWAEDHYQQIPCDQASDSLNPVPLDMEKVQHFKKIPCPETIKKTELGKYWYCKLKNREVEFYTAGGFHPVDTKRRLKPLTNYMYETYITGRTPCP